MNILEFRNLGKSGKQGIIKTRKYVTHIVSNQIDSISLEQ